jgi:hypothetical protein
VSREFQRSFRFLRFGVSVDELAGSPIGIASSRALQLFPPNVY